MNLTDLRKAFAKPRKIPAVAPVATVALTTETEPGEPRFRELRRVAEEFSRQAKKFAGWPATTTCTIGAETNSARASKAGGKQMLAVFRTAPGAFAIRYPVHKHLKTRWTTSVHAGGPPPRRLKKKTR